MGLDMYLWIKEKNKDKMEEGIYWRKVNCVQNWFCKELHKSNEETNCKKISVKFSLLEKLKSTILCIISQTNENLKLKFAEEMLPCCSGFFYGSQEYDDNYFNDLYYTLSNLNKLIMNHKKGNRYYYEAWY